MHRLRPLFIGLLIITVFTLAACGNKGSLQLPDPPKPEPAPVVPATAPAGATP